MGLAYNFKEHFAQINSTKYVPFFVRILIYSVNSYLIEFIMILYHLDILTSAFNSGSLFFEHRKFTWPSMMKDWKCVVFKRFTQARQGMNRIEEILEMKNEYCLLSFHFICTVKFANRCYMYEHGNKLNMLAVKLKTKWFVITLNNSFTFVNTNY